jgi:hypothetical protein
MLRGPPNHPELLSATALVEETLGRWEAALAHLTRAQALDANPDLVPEQPPPLGVSAPVLLALVCTAPAA